MLIRNLFIGLVLVYLFSGCSAIEVLKTNARLHAKFHPNDAEAQANLLKANTVGTLSPSSNMLLDVGIGALTVFIPAAGAVLAAMKKKTDAVNLAKRVAPMSEEEGKQAMLDSNVAV